jgi:hypothetical protein
VEQGAYEDRATRRTQQCVPVDVILRYGVAARRELAREHRAEELGKQALVAEPVQGVYTFNFGMHKGRTIAEVVESEMGAGLPVRPYIPYLFACRSKSGPQQYLIELELALRREGWWDRFSKEALAMAPALKEASVLKLAVLNEKAHDGQRIHPDVLKEARLRLSLRR